MPKIATKETCLVTVNPDLAKEWHPTKNGDLTPENVFSKSGKKVWWKCPVCKTDHDREDNAISNLINLNEELCVA